MENFCVYIQQSSVRIHTDVTAASSASDYDEKEPEKQQKNLVLV